MNGTIAEVRLFASNFAPSNWAYCEGQLLPVSSNTALFSIIGVIYGGDGKTTFALPDFRGRGGIHPGHGPGLSSHSLGQKGGQENVTLTQSTMPSHSHAASGRVMCGVTGGGSSPESKFFGPLSGRDSTGSVQVTGFATDSNAKMAQGDVRVNLYNNGGNVPFSIRNPYTAINFIICMYGIYPSRG